MIVGILHPGSMGSAVGRCVDADVIWVSEGRSAATAERAAACGFRDVVALEDLVAASDMIISVCPPEAAETVAHSVSETGFTGLYVDANAIAPETSKRIARGFAGFVDAGIVGGPPSGAGETRLYLSGPRSGEVAALFAGSDLEPVAIGPEIGRASALKASYAGWTKGSAALLLNQAAYARSEGVLELLLEEVDISIPGLEERIRSTAARIGLKAWRFAGEMDEIATAMGDRALPAGFHQGARSIFTRLEELKGEPGGQPLGPVLDRIIAAEVADD